MAKIRYAAVILAIISLKPEFEKLKFDLCSTSKARKLIYAL
jgi:hypothetical protein